MTPILRTFSHPLCLPLEVSASFKSGTSVSYTFQESLLNKRNSSVLPSFSLRAENISLSFRTSQSPALLLYVGSQHQEYLALLLNKHGGCSFSILFESDCSIFFISFYTSLNNYDITNPHYVKQHCIYFTCKNRLMPIFPPSLWKQTSHYSLKSLSFSVLTLSILLIIPLLFICGTFPWIHSEKQQIEVIWNGQDKDRLVKPDISWIPPTLAVNWAAWISRAEAAGHFPDDQVVGR